MISYLFVLLAVAFFTLLERKSLGYIQLRKGPNKVGYFGLIQPLADALKLFLKEENSLQSMNKLPYYLAPMFSLTLALSMWTLYWTSFHLWSFSFGLLFFLCVSALNVYGVMAAGWSSNSKYSLLGALRSVAQTISYEVSLFLILLSVMSISSSFSFFDFSSDQKAVWNCFILMPLSMMWFVATVAETNRAPFDFAEGESELVSGFNIEYGGGLFALIFLAEYANILFMSMMSSILFLGNSANSMLLAQNDMSFWAKSMLLAFIFIWIRGSYPRLRYDLLMKLTWLSFLPVSLLVLLWSISAKFVIVIS
uniref:NADH-ubiquinone oxidoreductase chain 1 n=1 Tax=Chaetopleura apiculata TaxID=58794 RepID=A0A343S5A7_CHAAP|nr:NADH dehydrogenase subunit 1 [Chaetopleura apiculata]